MRKSTYISIPCILLSLGGLQANTLRTPSSVKIDTHSKDQIVITGTITDQHGIPLPFASVCFKGTTYGCVSSIDGVYTLKAPNESGLLIEASSLGYITVQLEVEGRRSIDIVLQEDVHALEEAVVIGYGSVNKKDLTGSVISVKQEDLALIKTQSVENALAGQVAGLNIATTSGKPGEGSSVNIRGLNSVNGANQPLYVIDGVPVMINQPAGEGSPAAAYNQSNPLLTIHPDNVERIDVLKDASAAAIYGSRAANGVILITTKRGKRNQKPTLSFSASFALQNPSNYYNYLDADQYRSFMTEQAQYNWDTSTLPEAMKPTRLFYENGILNNPNYFKANDTDWQRELQNKNALWSQYAINISGGSDQVNYMISASTSDQEGVLIGNDFKRHSFSANLDANITKRFKVGGSISYNYSEDKSSGIHSLNQGNYRPDYAILDENGFASSYLNNRRFYELNPVSGDANNDNSTSSQHMYGNLYGELDLLPSLKFKSELNTSVNSTRIRNFTPSFNREFYAIYWNKPGATLQSQNNFGYSTTFTNTLTFDKTIDAVHKVNALAGIAWDKYQQEAEGHTLRIFPDDNNLTNQNSASIIEDNISNHTLRGLNSYFARVNYGYDDRYLATMTMRIDGSTKFGPGNQYGYFPSGAVAWNMHNEDFMQSFSNINRMKLRASYGRTGSDNLPSFTYLPYYQAGNFYEGINGIVINGVPNENIKWESTDQLDLGLEFGLFDYRLNAEIVYFEKFTSDIILFVPIPYETGSTSWSNNIADVSNKGWEIMVGGDIFRGDFTWNSSLNISFIKNKVEDLKGGESTSFGRSEGIIKGEPIGVIYGYDVDRIAQNKEEIDQLNKQAGGSYHNGLKAPGDYIFTDQNGDGKITTEDRTVIGNINPDFFGGWNNHFSYKNFTLGMNWVYSYGAQKEWSTISDLYAQDLVRNPDQVVLDTWTPTQTDAQYARYGSSTHGYIPTSKSVVDASYLRLQSLSLAYNHKGEWLKKLAIQNLRLSVIGNNLCTITHYPGLDPQAAGYNPGGASATSTSDDGFSYPNTRIFTFSVHATF